MQRLGVPATSPPASEPKPEPGGPGSDRSRCLLGMRVDAVDYLEAAERILAMAASGGGITCVATVHMLMTAFDDPAFRRIVNDAALVTADGMPLVWSLRALGLQEASRVYGPELVPIVCAEAARRGVPVGFFGGTRGVLRDLSRALCARCPGLEIAFADSPPMDLDPRRLDDRSAQAIENSGAGVLFVGLGCPKQERWMDAHRELLSCAMVGVGAAFDFLSGAKQQAPIFLQRAGLEWLFRLACEPRRLWKRYAWHNPRFALRMAQQLWRERRALAGR